MEDSSERSPLLFFLFLLRHSSFFFASLARIYAYSDFGIVLSLFLFLLRAALGRSPLTLHCSFSLTNLAYPSSSHAPTCPLSSLSLILIPFIVDALARLAHPRSSSIMRSCALILSRPRSVLPTLHGLLRPALTSVRLLQSTPSRRARWLKFFLGFELSHCAASFVRLFSAR